MTFTLTATPDTVSIPPRVLLEATESDSAKPIQSCQFFRDGVALRFAANIAGDTAVAYDYDAPFDVSLEYRADAVEADGIILDWTETWASLAAWTSEVAGWSVAGGDATTTTNNSRIRRSTSGSIVRVTGPAPSITGSTGGVKISGCDSTGAELWSLTLGNAGGGEGLLISDTEATYFSYPMNSWTIDVSESSVTASGSGWSVTQAFSGSETDRLKVASVFSGATAASIGDISVYVISDSVPVSDTDTTSLTGITAAWLTNAAQPELAIQVTPDGFSDDHICFSPETLRETTAVSSSVALDIEGSPDTLTVVTGPRRNKVGSAELICLDTTARRLLETLLANNATIGIRFPAVLDYMALDDGFYAVGDLGLNRVQNPWDTRDEVTMASLPLTPSRPPAFDVLWQWTYDTLAQTGLTYDQTAATFPTYTDLLIGPTT